MLVGKTTVCVCVTCYFERLARAVIHASWQVLTVCTVCQRNAVAAEIYTPVL